jgi:hypothetical protein
MAVAFAHADTEAPVLLQAPPSRIAAAVKRLMSVGVDPERIVARRLDSGPMSFETLEAVARWGVQLGFAPIGATSDPEPAARAAIVAWAIERHGPGRVTIGAVSPAAVADGGLERFAEQLAGFGVTREKFNEALSSGAADLIGGGA